MTWDVDKVVRFAVKIDGWMDTDELAWLYEQAKSMPQGAQWVEVGCWKGRSTFATAMGLPPQSVLHAVDPFTGDYSSDQHWESRELPGWIGSNFYLVADLVANRLRLEDRVTITHHGLTSLAAAQKPELTFIDAVFLDGLHDYTSVKADITAWRLKLKKGGLLCGHDYQYDGVQQAVDELLQGVAVGPKNIWSVRV